MRKRHLYIIKIALVYNCPCSCFYKKLSTRADISETTRFSFVLVVESIFIADLDRMGEACLSAGTYEKLLCQIGFKVIENLLSILKFVFHP